MTVRNREVMAMEMGRVIWKQRLFKGIDAAPSRVVGRQAGVAKTPALRLRIKT